MTKDELLQRAYHWFEECPGAAHMYGCRGSNHLPLDLREPCNCGRDKLVSEIIREAFPPSDFKPTNGSHGEVLA